MHQIREEEMQAARDLLKAYGHTARDLKVDDAYQCGYHMLGVAGGYIH